MGLFNQAIRAFKHSVKNSFRWLLRRKPKRVKDLPDEIPASWSPTIPAVPGSGKESEKRFFITKHKKRLPGLLLFKRFLAGFLLLVNFSFSQFLLGMVGGQAQPMFLLFLLNSFILLDYLWKTRRKHE